MKKSLGFLVVGLCITTGCYLAYAYKNAEMFQEVAAEKVTTSESTNVKMKKYRLNKLWRSTAVARMERTGAIVHRRTLNDEEYHEQLGLKLKEEAAEVEGAMNKQELAEEIGDVLEVIDAIIAFNDLDRTEIEDLKRKKRDERGSYICRDFVTYVEVVPGSYLHHYYLKTPDRHEEILD